MSELQWYEKELTLQQAMDCIDENLRSSVRNFVAIGFYLKEIRNRKLYQEDGCQNFEEFVRKHYDRDKGWASKCIKVNDQLSQGGNSPILAKAYKSYKVYQLVELAYLTEEQRELASPDMTVKKIQAIRRPEPEPEVVTLQPELEVPEGGAVSQQSEAESEKASAVETPEQGRKERVQEQYRLQELYLYPFAKWLIKNHKEWFREDFQNRVEMVEQSERELKQYLGASRKGDRAYGFPVTSSIKAYARLFDNRIELTQFEGNEMTEVGTSEWFYLSAAVQAMWNEIALEEAQTLRKRTEAEPETAVPEPEGDEIEVDTNTCPPDNGSCRRQEWGTSPKEQAAGHRECVKCWADWKSRQKVLMDAAKVQREEAETEDECSCDTDRHDEAWFVSQWADLERGELGRVMRACRFDGTVSDKAKAIQEELSPYGAYCSSSREYVFDFHGFAGGLDFTVGQEKMHLKYGRFAKELFRLYDPFDERFDEKEIIPVEILDEEFEEDSQVVDTECTEVEKLAEPEEPELTDFQIAREELERAQRLLDKCLLDFPDESNINIRRLKTKVAALACYVCDLDDIENPPPKPVQPELPLLTNNDQRAAFVDAYETWPLWIETVQTGERYYRYDLEDGTSMVVKVYHAMLFDYHVPAGTKYEDRFREGYGRHEYYLLKPGKFFRDCEANRSMLIDKLKELQKKEKQKKDE